jgi:hypothetical protein
MCYAISCVVNFYNVTGLARFENENSFFDFESRVCLQRGVVDLRSKADGLFSNQKSQFG